MALNSSLEWRRGGGIDRSTHTRVCVWKKVKRHVPIHQGRQHLAGHIRLGNWRDFLSLSPTSLVSTVLIGPASGEIDFCGSRAAGKNQNSNDDSHLNPSFFFFIILTTQLNTVHTQCCFVIRPPAVYTISRNLNHFLIICFTIGGYITGDRYDRLSIPMSLPDYTAPRTRLADFPAPFQTIESIDRTAPNLKYFLKKILAQ